MKNIKLIKNTILCVCISLLYFGCTEADFQKYPKDNVTEGAFFTDAENVRQMLNSAYTSTREFYAYSSSSGFLFIAELPSDDSYNSKFNNTNTHITLNEITWQSDNTLFEEAWNRAYATISRCHLAMEHAETVMKDAALKARYVNEAKYLRALMYFNLVRTFGDVPLVLKDVINTEELFLYGREPKANVLAQIIADLKDASNLEIKYGNNSDIGYATGAAAKALLGEVYLTMHNYTEAKAVLGELISSGAGAGYGLMENYNDIFKAKNSNNKEIVFAVQFARGFDPSQGNPIISGAYPNESVPDPQLHHMLTRGSGTMLVTRDLTEAFEDTDPRRNMIESRLDGAMEVMQNQRTYHWTLKYFDEDMTDIIDSGCDLIIHRWADILLMYAEALNETGSTTEALNYLKQVRERVGLETDNSLGTNHDAMFLALENERRLELHQEGHRWFDLVRTGRAQTVINAHLKSKTEISGDQDPNIGMDNQEKGDGSRSIQDFQLIFPIPQSQININPDKLAQNAGY
ncbi:MAG: RagB/SusD family nutrient uptake outer membrane protein [Tannerella sp.]|jgi:hypothetical protein|nr:RagB/SusD family nutrient uptake outer membrane protein [Tannerella sp.]